MEPTSRLAGLSLRCLTKLGRDKTGATAVIVGLVSSVLIGFAGLGTEVGLWYFTHRNLQNAADSAAMSAVAALYNGGTGDYTAEARATAARYGFTDGSSPSQGPTSSGPTQGPTSSGPTVSGLPTVSPPTSGPTTTVTVNKPPLSGNFKTDANAVEVIISEPQPRLFSALFLATDPTQTVRAVATPGTNGNGCVVALDRASNIVDLFDNGVTNVNLQSCDLYVNSSASDAVDITGQASISAESAFISGGITSSGQAALTTSNGTNTGVAPINDPYINVPAPALPGSCPNSQPNSFTGPGSNGNLNIDPGLFCGGLTLKGNITMAPGIYFVDGGSFTSNGGATVTGNGVTIFLTGDTPNTCATMQWNDANSSLTLTPPTAGPLAGIAIFQDRKCTANPAVNTNKIGGGAAISITGVIYFPQQNVTYNGGANSGGPICEQLVSLTVTFHGNSHMQNNCAGVPGVAAIGAIPALLVE